MRRWLDRGFLLSVALCGAVACAILLGIAGAILWRGIDVLDWHFLTREALGAGASGGVLYEIAGTLILIVTALAVSAPLAMGVALVQVVYVNGVEARRRLLVALYMANAVPSVLFGVAGLMVFTRFLGWGKSWLAGGILLGLMILPTLSVAVIERMRSLPRKYLETAAGLGLSRSQIVWSVLVPQSAAGLISGALLGLARAAGETAPILFAAAVFSGAGLPSGIRDSPVVALPYHIFVLAQDSFDPAVESHLWGAAFVLLALVLGLSLAALPARLRLHEEAKNA
ncbi:MAG TPA: ABC transporter permease subunit [Thermoanaerobaculia bacterium]|nr:ABC transporter permease subunit [Thermoanaerobaculia bacterium]